MEHAAVKRETFNERLATGKDELGNPVGRVKLMTRTEQKVGEAAFKWHSEGDRYQMQVVSTLRRVSRRISLALAEG